MFGALKLDQANKLVCLPINDNTNPNLPSGGSHWNLLVRVNGHHFYHLDSAGGSNTGPQYMGMNVTDVARKLQTLCGKTSFGGNSVIKSLQSPQQQNSHDCGMYVLCFIEQILIEFVQNGKTGIEEVDLSIVTPQYVANKRGEILKLVQELIQINSMHK